ncbi:MAG: metallophosphoesterase [Desulfotomaculales bacterium]
MGENVIHRLFPRRRVLKIVIPGLVLLLLFGLAAGSGGVVVERVEVPLPGLPAELDGLTIVQISDLHYGFGRFRSKESVTQITRLISSLHPDLIVFTGDLLDRSAAPALADTLPLKGVEAPLGVYAVMGNHDHHFGKEKIARSLAEAGLEVLVNRSVRVQKGGRHFWLIGLDDPLTGDPDLAKAMAPIPPGDFKILLVHTPDFAPQVARAGIQLQLSGHSHGGQIRLPGVGAMYCPPLGREYPLGLREVPGSSTRVYTNRGLGTTVLPLRLFCPPEVTLLALRSGTGNCGGS